MKYSIKILLIGFFTNLSIGLQAQNLDYLKPLGTQLLADIENKTFNSLAERSVLETYLKKVILPGQGEEMAEEDIPKTLDFAQNSFEEKFKQSVSEIVDQLNAKDFEFLVLDFYTAIPLTVEIHESKNTGAFSVPDKTKDNLSTIRTLFVIGDDSKRMIITGIIVRLNDKYQLLQLEAGLKTYSFSSGLNSQLFKQVKRVVEKQVSPSQTFESSPLIGEKLNNDWYKCTIQLAGERNPTLIRSVMSSDGYFGMETKTEIKVELYNNLSGEEALSYTNEVITLLGHEFSIAPSSENKLNSSLGIKPYTYQLLNKDSDTGHYLGQLQLNYSSKNETIFEVKVKSIEEPDGTYNLELWLIAKK